MNIFLLGLKGVGAMLLLTFGYWLFLQMVTGRRPF